MKTKPILITAAVVIVLAAGIFFLIHSKKHGYRADKSELVQFLNGFNNEIKEGHATELLGYFDKKNKILKRLTDLLAGNTGIDGKEKPLVSMSFDVDNAEIKSVSASTIEATLPVSFKNDSLNTWRSALILKIKKVGLHKYKIVQVDARRFLDDYASYENLLKRRSLNEKDIYSAITLEAFKTAGQLKSKYDSVVWFAHLNNKSYFYVVKGKWDMEKDLSRDKPYYKDSVIDPYKMGLLNPDLKEIVPVEYDLVHSINATFDGLVEVEKDNKKGFYNLDGKLVVPVSYDQVFPIADESNLAILKSGNDYFYLKKDTTISEKVNLKMSDFFTKIKNLSNAYDLNDKALSVITEYNSKDEQGALYLPPSYLVDMNIALKWKQFKNPLRKVDFEYVSSKYEVKYAGGDHSAENWFTASFYNIRDYFLGGRSEFYDKRNIVIIDKKLDRVFTQDIGTDYTPGDDESALGGVCDITSIRAINDTLFEVKSGANMFVELYDSTRTVMGGTYYHYLVIRNNELKELPNKRNFGFTKYVKMDDSYLEGCYQMLIGANTRDGVTKTLDRITPEMLKYMKNEIFAGYRYRFKDKRWQNVFMDMEDEYDPKTEGQKPLNANVDDSLTAIDKYNINWIMQKLKGGSTKTAPANTLAAK